MGKFGMVQQFMRSTFRCLTSDIYLNFLRLDSRQSRVVFNSKCWNLF